MLLKRNPGSVAYFGQTGRESSAAALKDGGGTSHAEGSIRPQFDLDRWRTTLPQPWTALGIGPDFSPQIFKKIFFRHNSHNKLQQIATATSE